MLPTLQVRFGAGPTTLALMVAVFWIASSVTQPVFGALGEDIGLRVVGCVGVLMASAFLSLIGVASELWLVFALLVVSGLGSAALHPVGTTIASTQASNATHGVGLFTAGGMVGFALGPVLILHLVSTYGSDATVWLALPGLILGAGVGLLLPKWEPHPRRPLRRLFDLRLVRGPVGLLAVASMFSALAFVTFSGSIPIWLVQENATDPTRPSSGGRSRHSPRGRIGSILGGFLAPGLGPILTIVGAPADPRPTLAVVASEPGTDPLLRGDSSRREPSSSCPFPHSSSSRRSMCLEHPRRHRNGSRAWLSLGWARVHHARARSGRPAGLTNGIVIGFRMVVRRR